MIKLLNYSHLFAIPVVHHRKHPGLLIENTRVFSVQTPGSFDWKHPGVLVINTRVFMGFSRCKGNVMLLEKQMYSTVK